MKVCCDIFVKFKACISNTAGHKAKQRFLPGVFIVFMVLWWLSVQGHSDVSWHICNFSYFVSWNTLSKSTYNSGNVARRQEHQNLGFGGMFWSSLNILLTQHTWRKIWDQQRLKSRSCNSGGAHPLNTNHCWMALPTLRVKDPGPRGLDISIYSVTRDHLSWRTTCFWQKVLHFSVNEPVTEDHPSWETTFLWTMGQSFKTGCTV